MHLNVKSKNIKFLEEIIGFLLCFFWPWTGTTQKAGSIKEKMINWIPSQLRMFRGFPRSPVVKTLPSSAGGMGSFPGQGTKIPHVVGCGKNLKKKKRKFTLPKTLLRKWKDQLQSQRKIFSNIYISNKGLVSEYIKNSQA